MKRLAINVAIVLAIGTAALLAWRMRGAVVLLLVSIAIAGAVRPPAESLMRRGLSRGLSLTLIYGVLLSGLAALVSLLGPPMLAQVPAAVDELVAGYESLRTHAASGSHLERMIGGAMPAWSEVMRRVSGDLGGIALQALFATRSLFEVLTSIMVTLVLSVYWAARRDPFELGVSLFAEPLRAHMIRVEWRNLWALAGGHLGSMLLRGALAASLLALELRVLELRFWALGAVAAAIAGLMPFIGLLLALGVGALLGLPGGQGLALMVALLSGATVIAVEHVSQRFLQVHRGGPIALVLCALGMLQTLGIVGLLLAAPLAAMLTHLVHFALQRRTAWHFATRGECAPGLPGALDSGYGTTR